MIAAFLYLTLCSIRNGVRVRIRQLRQPRYILIAAGFVLWIGSMTISRRTSGAVPLFALDGTRAWMIAIAVATLLLASAWRLPVSAGLGFTSPEVQFLFPAPITRRQLIGYKIARLLTAPLASGVFLTVVMGPSRFLPALLFAAKTTIVLGIVSLHATGVAMYRTKAREQGHLGGRRWRVLAAAAPLMLALGAALVFIAFSSSTQLAVALPLAALLIGANAVWIIRSDAAFEEAATEAADKMSQARATGHFSTPRISRKRSTPFPLAPRGPVETAILWKNWLLLGRTSRQVLIVSAITLVSLVAAFFVAADAVTGRDIIGEVCLFFVALAVLLGPAMLRVDLRQDLGHLALIKTWPVRGPAVIRGEVLAPAIALSLSAGVAIAIGSALAPTLLIVDDTGAAARAAFGVSAVLAVTAVIVAQLVVHNGIAACFPAWVEIKPVSGTAAMELNVRMMVVMYGAMLVLALVALIPAAAAAAAYFLAGGLLIPSAIFAALLLAESIAATEVIGRILDRTDLQDVVVRD